jgi:hypothetical protein
MKALVKCPVAGMQGRSLDRDLATMCLAKPECPLWVKSRHSRFNRDVRFVPLADVRHLASLSRLLLFEEPTRTGLRSRSPLSAVSDGMFPVRKFLRSAVYRSAALIDSIKANSHTSGHKVDAHFF